MRRWKPAVPETMAGKIGKDAVMTLGRAVMAILALLAVAACGERVHEEVSPPGQNEPGQDDVATIPVDRHGAALPPRESGVQAGRSDPMSASAESFAQPPVVEPTEQPREENTAKSHARTSQSAETQASTAEPSEPQESFAEPPKPPERSEPAEQRETVEARVADTDYTDAGQSGVATQAGKIAIDPSGGAGTISSVAAEVEDQAATGENDPTEKPAPDTTRSLTVERYDETARTALASVVEPVSDAPATNENARLERRDKIDVEAAIEPVARQPGISVAAGAPGVNGLNQIAALPDDLRDSDAVAEFEEAGEPETRPENQPLSCNIVRLLGNSIGQWRLRGESSRAATRKAADEVARKIKIAADERFGFKARVYADRIYDLKPNHTLDGFAAYAYAACLVLTGRKGLIPVDETSKDMLDQALRGCESGARGDGELDACISQRMEKIVQERGRRTD